MGLLTQSIFRQSLVHLTPRNPGVCTSHKPDFLAPSPSIKLFSIGQISLPSLCLYNNCRLRLVSLASVSPPPSRESPQSPNAESTLTLKMVLLLTVSAAIFFAKGTEIITLHIAHSMSLNLKPLELAGFQSLQGNLLGRAGPLCFAAMSERFAGPLNTPMTVVVAAGASKWLDIFSGVLMIRVLLSWFPNCPWEKQPFPAIRSLCDPYLNLFRNIIPPISGSLDVSPLLAFLLLGLVGSLLKTGGAAA